MPINSTNELWAAVERIATSLDMHSDNQATNFAEQIRQAMRISSVGTEVWMATRFALTEVQKSRIQLNEEERIEIDSAIKALSAGLNG